MSEVLLETQDLSVAYATEGAPLRALHRVSVQARAGEALGVVGESGCGKSTLAAAMIGLLARNARTTDGRILFRGRDVAGMSAAERRRLRGRRIAMVGQDPGTAFNPVLTLGSQLTEFLEAAGVPRAERRPRAMQMLARVGIADPERCLDQFPHELSGGMRQRIAIAAALLMEPEVLIADEPTTALDVTMEAQIIHLLRGLRAEFGGAIVIVTHHLGVVAELCGRVVVMYAGEVVEEGPVDAIFHAPRHPYTAALLACDPAGLGARAARLPTIGGTLPDLTRPREGCSFAPRCPQAAPVCDRAAPRVSVGPAHAALCHAAQGGLAQSEIRHDEASEARQGQGDGAQGEFAQPRRARP